MHRLFLLTLLCGCSAQPTTVLVQVSADMTPSSLTASVFNRFGVLNRRYIEPVSLPGTLLLTGLPDSIDNFRLVISSDGELGGAPFTSQPHTQQTLPLALSADRADTDQDGVPDDLDDCPQVYDPDQRSATGTPPGDACIPGGGPGPDDGGDVPGDDLLGVDLLGADLLVPSPCGNAALLCDDFETGAIERGRWPQIVQHSGTVTIDNSRAHRGTYSLHAHIDGSSVNQLAQAWLGETSTFPYNQLYLRAYVYVPSPASTAAADVLRALQTPAPYQGLRLRLDTDGTFSGYNDIGGPKTITTSTKSMPLDSWTCVEWEIVFGTSGQTRLWVNGSEVTSMAGTQNTLASPPIDQLRIGVMAYMDGGPHDIWFDDLMIDPSPIGCAK
jgi:hypothetical protein